MKLYRQLVVVGLLCGGGLLLHAQTPDPAAKAESATTESTTNQISHPHHTVVVTATRTPTPSREIGQSLTTITAEEIAAQGARDVLQVLERVPGFNVARSGSFGGSTSVFVRGGESDFNLVLIDGIQVNQPGGFYDFADLSTANVERIEIVRGPSSVLYGADSVSSVINVITRKGEGGLSGNLHFEGGTHNTYLLHGGVQGEANGVHYSFGTHYARSDGFLDFNNNYDKADVSGQTTLDLGGNSYLTGQFRLLIAEHQFPTDSTGRVIDPNDFRRTDERLYSVSYQNLVNDRYSTTAKYGYYSRDFKNFTIRDDIVDFFDSTFRTQEDRHVLDWENHLQLSPHHLLAAGVSFEREAIETNESNRRSVGFFAQDQISWGDLFLTLGGRYDNNDRFKSFATGTLSVAYLIGEQWKLRGSLGNGFRAPSFAEIIGFTDFDIRGNPNLSPEKNLASEVGLDYFSSGRQLGISATVFFNRFSDLIEFSFLVPAGSPNYLNIERAKSEGLELSGYVEPLDRVRLGAHYTLTQTEVTDAGMVPGGSFAQGERLLRRPGHLAGVYAQYLRHRYQLRLDIRYKGQRDDVQFFPDFSSSRVALPSYWRTDVAVTIPILGLTDSRGDLALVVRGENVFNTEYTEVAGFESIGRVWFAGLDLSF